MVFCVEVLFSLLQTSSLPDLFATFDVPRLVHKALKRKVKCTLKQASWGLFRSSLGIEQAIEL